MENHDQKIFVDFLNAYNECFYQKDLVKLRDFYGSDLIYFDNHKHNDTYDLEEHLSLLSDFFEHGKSTESGKVEPLIIENLKILHRGDTACLCFLSKYASVPVPAVRSTLYLEHQDDRWKIFHAHYSFQPDK